MDKSDYDLRAGLLLGEEMRVLCFSGREELSAPYSFEIDVACDLDPVGFQVAVLGHPAVMSWRTFPTGIDPLDAGLGDEVLDPLGQSRRYVHGVVTGFSVLGETVRSGTRYRVELAPRLSLLRKRTNSRIFQRKTARQIIDTIFREHGISASWGAGTTGLKKLEYAVQYRETDFDFVSRLLGEEGILYYFEQPPLDVSALPGLVADVVARVSTAVATKDADSLSSFSPMSSLPHETVVLVAEASYQPLGASQVSGMGGGLSLSGTGTIKTVGGALAGRLGLGAGVEETLRPTVPYRPVEGMAAREESIHEFAWRRRLEPQSAVRKETRLLDATTTSAQAPARESTDHFLKMLATMARSIAPDVDLSLLPQAPMGNAMQQLMAGPVLQIPNEQLQVYEHGEGLHEFGSGKAVKLTYEELRARAIVATGRGNCRRMSPGYAFCVSEFPVLDINANYVLTTVTHKGETNFYAEDGDGEPHVTYSNTFSCVPEFVAVRPRRVPARMQQVLETATVIGLPGQVDGELYSGDAGNAGRVRVRFHWDREADLSAAAGASAASARPGAKTSRDESASCWLPVTQAWAGRSFGFQFVPRVGMEVVVGFLDGDGGCPVVLGALHHQIAQPPFVLPHHATQSGIKTKSIGENSLSTDVGQAAGGGQPERYNQLRFEDKLGHEFAELYSSGDTKNSAGRNAYIHARELLKLDASDIRLTAHDNCHIQIEEDNHYAVYGSQILSVGQAASRTTGENLRESVGASYQLSVAEDYEVLVQGGARERVTGGKEVLITGDHAERCGGEFEFYAQNGMLLESMGVIDLESTQSIRLRCGTSEIVLSPNAVHIRSDVVNVESTRAFRASGEKAYLELKDGTGTLSTRDEVRLYTEHATLELTPDYALVGSDKEVKLLGKSASLVLDSNACLDGEKVSLKKPSGEEFSAHQELWEDETGKLHYVGAQFLSPEGEPLAGENVVLLDSESDRVVAGPVLTDEEGKVRVQVPVGRQGDERSFHLALLPDPVPPIPYTDDPSPIAVWVRFVDLHRNPIANEEVEVNGGGESEVFWTDDDGILLLPGRSGEFALSIWDQEFHTHSLQTADTSGPHVFIVEPPLEGNEDDDDDEARSVDRDSEGEDV